jgi:class 3 adenylate cyclase/tetratricopeptide (TPR) repeat protein
MSVELPARRAEQITATAVFADVVGFSRLSAQGGAEGAYLAVTHLLRLLDGIARKHGGSVDKYLGDKLMAVFGYPVPLERPERAAAAAALEMRQRVLDYNREADLAVPFDIHMGINTGELMGGDIRGPVVREFHVLGDSVNVAARLNAKAPDGEIWVGPRTYEAAKDDFTWDVLEPLHLKGKSKPVPAFALKSERGAAPRGRLGFDERAFSELVGRDAELSRLRARAGSLAAGRGGAVLVRGEEGCGKSRLLAALGEAEEIEKLAVLQGRASPVERARRFAAFAPVVAGWAGIDADAEPGERAAQLKSAVERRLPDAPAEAVELLGRILDLPGLGEPRAPGVAAESVEVVCSLLASAARERPLLLVLEDVQWLDPNSQALLERLLPLAAEVPLLLLLTGRPGQDTAQLAAALKRQLPESHEALDLAPLELAAARSLVVAALGDDADEETLQLVLERGGDLPGPLLLAAFLAPALRSEREQQAQRAERTSEAERRRAAVLFADLSGFTAMTEKVGAEQAYPVVASCLQILDDAARAHGGTVDHYLGDCVMALFGVPRAIEDAPRAALNASIDMRRRIRAFNEAHDLAVPVDVHTGVATGLGIAGDISGPLIREFAVMGDHVDRADQLCHAAESGEIRLDGATHHATREVFQFREAESLELPGSDGLETTFDLQSTAPRLHRARLGAERQVFSELVGRDEDLARLRQGLAALEKGEGGVACLEAEAGLGKSRLLAELRGADEVAVWLEGRALSNGRNLRYHPIADLVRSWAAIADDDDDARARGKVDAAVAALLPEGVSDTAPLLANLVGVPLSTEERQRLDAIQGDALEKLVRGAIVQLLRAASALRPLVVVMEDLHWADLSSVELVESLLRLAAEQPILFLNVFRPGFEDTSDRVVASAREHLPERLFEVSLEPLGAEAARTLVKNLFRGGDVPQTTRAAIEERAQGNPFYIEEVVRNLVDAGAVELRGGRFYATEKLASATIPHTVQEAVMARVDRLDLRPKSVLQAASVIGGSFHQEVLESVLEDPDEIPDLLAELEDGEFIVPSDRSAGIEYAFRHPLVQEVTYDAILATRRQELHHAVAEAVETRLDTHVPGYYAMLAYHFSMGRDAERAEDYLFQAGDDAARAAASNEALHFFQQASALYKELHGEGGEPEKRARLEKSLAIALLNRGRLIEAVDHFDRTTALLGAPASRRPVSMVAGFVANLVRVLLGLYLSGGRRRRAATPQELELFDVMFKRAIAQSSSAPTAFLVDCMALLRRLRAVDPYTVPESAAMYAGVVAIFSYGGLSFSLGARFLEMAHDLARGGAVDERVLYYRTLGYFHHILVGDWSDEHEVEDALVEQGIREGRFWEASTCVNLQGVKHVYQGDFAPARESIRRLEEIADVYQYDWAASAQHALTAYLAVERREFDAALRALELYYDERAEPVFNLLALGTRAKVETLLGQLDEAKATLERAEKVLEDAGRAAPYQTSSVRSARYLLEVALLEDAVRGGDRGVLASRRKAVREARKAAFATADKVALRRPEALRMAGREARLEGDLDAALGWWEKALACCESLGTRPELGRTLADAAQALAETPERQLAGRNADACRREALAIFDELDLAFDRKVLVEGA